MNGKNWIVTGSILAGIAVAMGALAAHGLESWLAQHFPDDAPKRIENWKTAANYQMYHAIGIVLVGIVGGWTNLNRWLNISAWAMLAGIGLFSGMLYAWVLTDIGWLVMFVPLGGISFILGWFGLAGAVGACVPASGKSGP